MKPGHIALVAGGGGTKLSFGQTLDARQVALAITRDVTFASNGDLLLAETTACRVDRVDASTGMISVDAGQPCSQLENYLDGPANVARFYAPFSVAQGADGSLHVADTGNGVIRRIDASSSVVSTYAGTPEVQGFAGDGGPRTQAEFAYPSGGSLRTRRLADRDRRAE